MRDRGQLSRLLDTIEKRKARIYESVVSIIVLMLWIVDVRPKVDVILFLKSIRNLYAREYLLQRCGNLYYPRIERKSKFKALLYQNVSFSANQY